MEFEKERGLGLGAGSGDDGETAPGSRPRRAAAPRKPLVVDQSSSPENSEDEAGSDGEFDQGKPGSEGDGDDDGSEEDEEEVSASESEFEE